MKIWIASDHRGVELKAAACRFFKDNQIPYEDLGTDSNASVDYPDYASLVATRVVAQPDSLGVLFCGTGFGMAIAANKFKGIRAVSCDREEQAVLSRQHNNTNVLTMGELYVRPDQVASILDAWLHAQFLGGRHQQRIDKIASLESNLV